MNKRKVNAFLYFNLIKMWFFSVLFEATRRWNVCHTTSARVHLSGAPDRVTCHCREKFPLRQSWRRHQRSHILSFFSWFSYTFRAGKINYVPHKGKRERQKKWEARNRGKKGDEKFCVRRHIFCRRQILEISPARAIATIYRPKLSAPIHK